MYNGIGLRTPRGSGTNGYVQANRAYIPQRSYKLIDLKESFQELPPKLRPINKEILLHEKKRDIERQLLEWRIELEEKNTPKEEIEERIANRRKLLLSQLERDMNDTKKWESEVLRNIEKREERQKFFNSKKREGNLIAEAQIRKNERAMDALRIPKDFVSGAAFDKELQEKKRLERIQQYEKKRKEREEKESLSEEERSPKRSKEIKNEDKKDEKKSRDDEDYRRDRYRRSPYRERYRRRSYERRRYSRSPPRRRRSPSPERRRRSPSPEKRKRSPSPERRKHSKSPERRRRSPSPQRKRDSKSPSPPRRRRSPSPERRKRGSSPERKPSKSPSPPPEKRRDSKSPSPKRRSPSVSSTSSISSAPGSVD